MAFVWRSNSSVTFRDMETTEIQCPRCQAMQKHTFRMYEKKDKAYSVLTTSTERQVTVVCHRCLFERYLEEKLRKIASKVRKGSPHKISFQLIPTWKTRRRNKE